jgi:hypothetical protein
VRALAVIRLRTFLLPFGVLALGCTAAVAVFRDAPRADWIALSAPSVLTIGQRYTVTLTLSDPRGGDYLVADLHGLDSHRRSLGVIRPGHAEAVSPLNRTYTFSFVVNGRPRLKSVHVVAYLSPSGHWHDHRRVARSEPIDLVHGYTAPSKAIDLGIYDHVSAPEILVPNPFPLRLAIALLWGFAAGLAGLSWWRSPYPRNWPVLVIVLLGCACWEFTSVGSRLSDVAREIAQHAGFYEERRLPQEIATAFAVVVLSAGAAAALIRSQRHVPAAVIMGVSLFAVVGTAGMLSLHDVDRVLATDFGAIALAPAIRLLAPCLAIVGLLHRRGRAD